MPNYNAIYRRITKMVLFKGLIAIATTLKKWMTAESFAEKYTYNKPVGVWL